MNNNFSQMNKERKRAVIFLGIFSIIIIVALFLNIYNNIKSPVDLKKMVLKDDVSKTCSDGNCLATADDLSADNMELKNKDTDGDGLSDWDELFIYETSPFLEDTDGDGLSDFEEIYTYKTDPLCPEGQDCSGLLSQDSAQENSSSQEEIDAWYVLLNSLEDLDGSDASVTTSIGVATSSDLINNQTDYSPNSNNININPVQLRSLLIENGTPKEELDLISDAELIKLYQEIAASQ